MCGNRVKLFMDGMRLFCDTTHPTVFERTFTMIIQNRKALIAASLIGAMLVAGAAISDVAHGKAFPTENIHATPAMQAQFPELF